MRLFYGCSTFSRVLTYLFLADETIYPVDFKTAGQMTDDEMHDLMVRPLPQGCRLTAIFDSVSLSACTLGGSGSPQHRAVSYTASSSASVLAGPATTNLTDLGSLPMS